ncbi:copper-binding protein [Paraburkholderia sediminicola]|uniref:copper-binding protein n=1 Tax=Paraburkholderia sediminicola TaxID=458836 RepID=UPI0038B70802
MRETRKVAARLHIVAVAVSIGLLLFQSAVAEGPSPRPGRHTVDVKALRHIQGRVAGIDPLYNRVTLRDTRGEMVVFEISPDIADVKTLQLGDTVNIAYRNAIVTHMDKVASSGIRERIETEVLQPASDGEVSSTRSVEFVATVLKIDRKNREVTLRGPTQTQEFDVAPTSSLDNLKVGDPVRAKFNSAVAASLVRVATAAQ